MQYVYVAQIKDNTGRYHCIYTCSSLELAEELIENTGTEYALWSIREVPFIEEEE